MSDEGVWLDPETAHDLAAGCRRAAENVEGVRDDALAALTLAGLTGGVTGLLAEMADELTMLAKLVDVRADLMEYADVPTTEGWLRYLYAEATALADGLAVSLDDEDGATRTDAAPITLAGTVTLGFEDPVLMQANWDRDVWGDYGWGDDRGYWGGGYAIGPDGRQYPIVIPWMEIDGHVYTADSGPGVEVATLGGRDDGWSIVTVRSGVERIQEEPNLFAELAAGLAGSTGLVTPLPDDEMLPGIVMNPDRPPWLASEIPLPRPVRQPDVAVLPVAPMMMIVNGRLMQVQPDELAWAPRDIRRAVANTTVLPPSTAGTVITGALDLAVPAGQGLDMALSLDNQNQRAYQVIYEENDDGRIRARVETFWLTSDGETVAIQPRHLFFDEDGQLAEQPIEYAPYTAAVVTPDGDFVVAQGVDLPSSWEIQDDVIPE